MQCELNLTTSPFFRLSLRLLDHLMIRGSLSTKLSISGVPPAAIDALYFFSCDSYAAIIFFILRSSKLLEKLKAHASRLVDTPIEYVSKRTLVFAPVLSPKGRKLSNAGSRCSIQSYSRL